MGKVPVATAHHDWVEALRGAGRMRVAVVGGSGRLGSRLVRFLVKAGHQVVVLDTTPPQPLNGLRFVGCDLLERDRFPYAALRGCTAVVHLAALHGAHLVSGADRRRFWAVNVDGTHRALDAARRAGVGRFVLASTTSVYGPGSPAGQPARVLDEETPLAPEDIYDLTKIAAERLLREAARDGMTGVALRLGRFFFPSVADYHLRKLSTGLDVRDACQAVALALLAPPGRRAAAYCVASDLPLEREQRRRLGLDAAQVLDEVLPTFAGLARRRGVAIPSRVGKSVSTAAIRRALGYAPERSLAWLESTWSLQPRQAPRPRAAPQRRRVTANVDHLSAALY